MNKKQSNAAKIAQCREDKILLYMFDFVGYIDPIYKALLICLMLN